MESTSQPDQGAVSPDNNQLVPFNSEMESPPHKKQRQEDDGPTFNLFNIALVFVRGEKIYACALSAFIVHNVTGAAKIQDYDYDTFCEWLETACEVSAESSVIISLRDSKGNMVDEHIANKWDFFMLLLQLQTGSCRVIEKHEDYAFYIQISDFDDHSLLALPVAVETITDIQGLEASQPSHAGSPSPRGDEHDTGIHESIPSKPPSPICIPSSSDTSAYDLADAPSEFSLESEQQNINFDLSAAPNYETWSAEKARLTGYNDENWQKTMRMFVITENDTGKYHIKGIKADRDAHRYQLIAVRSLLMNPLLKGVNGGMIGFDVGLGKTMVVLLYFRIRARLAFLWDAVQEEWIEQQGQKTNLRKHLPKEGAAPGIPYPSQRSALIECPCIRGSESRQICETYLTNSPGMIIMPPSLITNWLNEMRNVYADAPADDKDEVATKNSFMNIRASAYDCKDSLSFRKDKNAEYEWFHEKGGELTEMQYNEGPQDVIAPAGGDARDVILTSFKTAKAFVDKFPKVDVDTRKNISIFTASTIVMDEFQGFKGTKNTTQPFQALDIMQKVASHPIALITLCSTTLEEGPTAWQSPIKHFEAQWKEFGNAQLQCTDESGYEATTERLSEVQRVYLKQVQSLTYNQTKVEAARAALAPFVPFFKQFMLCLRRDQIYRGQPILRLPKMTISMTTLKTIMNTETMHNFRRLMGAVNTLVDEQVRKKEAAWDKKSEAEKKLAGEPKPTRQIVVTELQSGDLNPVSSDFITLQRVCMYPYLYIAKQYFTKTDPFIADTCQKFPSKVQKAINTDDTPSKLVLAEHIQTWDFFPYIDRLVASSAKLKHIKLLIKDMIEDDNDNTAPEDGSGKRHAIVFFSQPISAALTYVFLLIDEELRNKIDVFYLASSEGMAVRPNLVRKMNEPCTPNSKNKVMIAMSSVASEGFNIQQVNNIWFPELPPSLSKYYQAVGRAYRQGQSARVNLINILEEGN